MATKINENRFKSSVFIGYENGKRKYKVFYAAANDEADYLAKAYKTGRLKEKSKKTIKSATAEYIEGRAGASFGIYLVLCHIKRRLLRQSSFLQLG